MFNFMNNFNKISNFFKEVKAEIKKVDWLKKEEIIRYTLIVIGISFAVAIFLGGVDFIFTTFLKRFIL